MILLYVKCLILVIIHVIIIIPAARAPEAAAETRTAPFDGWSIAQAYFAPRCLQFPPRPLLTACGVEIHVSLMLARREQSLDSPYAPLASRLAASRAHRPTSQVCLGKVEGGRGDEMFYALWKYGRS